MSIDRSVVSVVIPMYNASATIGAQLESLAGGAHRPSQVVVVDNNSTDDSAAVASSYADRFDSFEVRPCSRQSANAARNVGVAACTGTHVAFLDADDRVVVDWFTEVTDALPWDAFAGGLRDCRVVDDAEWVAVGEDHTAVFEHGFLPAVCTASAGVRTEIWRDVGGFDESYSQGADDTEFFWRVMLAGHEVSTVPGAIVLYRMRPGTRAIWRQRWRHGLADARLHREYARRGWNVDYRRYHLRNIASNTKALVLSRIPPREWFARIVASSGALYASVTGRFDDR